MKTATKISCSTLVALFLASVPAAVGQTFPAAQPAETPGPLTSAAMPVEPEKKEPAKVEEKKEEKAVQETSGSDIPSSGPKVPDSVKGVVDKLDTATDDVTLEDLNSAREAVAKLDVLIDIEKRLSDLVSIRKDREEKMSGALSAMIPSSALRASAQPVAAQPVPMPVSVSAPFVSSGEPEKIEITRIVGADGRYVAYTPDGDKMKLLRQGDKLADGSVVESISRTGVRLALGKKKITIPVHDVQNVFGAK